MPRGWARSLDLPSAGPQNRSVLRVGLGLLALLCCAACERRLEQAVVIAKEHIAAAASPAATPEPSGTALNGESGSPPADEITVDTYVKEPGMRGARRDPRALKDEQWLVTVRTVAGGRTFNAPADREQFESLREGEQVEVRYRVGKYTSTVWAAEIVGEGR